MIIDKFATVLRELRQERGLSQEELGFEAGLHRTYISQLELGRKNPTLKTLYMLSCALDVSLTELVCQIEKGATSVSSERTGERQT